MSNNKWLIKADPESDFNWNTIKTNTQSKTLKSGLAQKFLKLSKSEDEVFIYHTGKEKQIVGIGEISKSPYRDKDNKFFVINITKKESFNHPVTLQKIRSESLFMDWYLVKMSRLSFMPVSDAVWNKIKKMSK